MLILLTVKKQEKKKNKHLPGRLQFEKLVVFHILGELLFFFLLGKWFS
jgi:hypothetical protein